MMWLSTGWMSGKWGRLGTGWAARPQRLWALAQRAAGGQPLAVACAKHWVLGLCVNVFISDLDGGAEYTCREFANNADWIGMVDVLDSSAVSQRSCAGWRNEQTSTSCSAASGSARYWAGARVTPGTSECWGLTRGEQLCRKRPGSADGH